ncbi:hypothetical protein ACFQGT_09815 [Natrialbaceae archaeon GCM10025810]|uniref:hypothetical protein n=1 Tax=Halovalidus salilacus TaxID=3075124 RepID=UPI0036204417
MQSQENALEQQQRLAMLVEVYDEYHTARVVGMNDRARDYIAEWFGEAEELFGDKTALVFELLNTMEDTQ